MAERFHTVVVGTGFAGAFFLREHLRHLPANATVLVLERGAMTPHAWQVENRQNSPVDDEKLYKQDGAAARPWTSTIAFGGGSNCWWACTPRFLPSDFEMQSRYGVGRDWPLGYDDLAPFYDEVEAAMGISGPDNSALFPRTGPYPQPPHRFSDPDRVFKQRWPDLYFQQPTARARQATEARGVCCSSSVCNLCPVDAKFTILNGMADVYDDPRVTLRLSAEALAVEFEAGRATAVHYLKDGRAETAGADLVVLGANALFNPFLLLRSGMTHPMLGRRLHEQVGLLANIYLDGIDAFQGSTSITANGYMLYDGPHRAKHAAILLESYNKPFFRPEPGRWRQLVRVKLIAEDLPDEKNRVELDPDDLTRPVARFEGISDYARAGHDAARAALPKLLEGLPVEEVRFASEPTATENHIQGTVVMGDDPADSVVDADLLVHDVRNLLVLGASAFPTSPPANPTLTLSAMAIRAARRLA